MDLAPERTGPYLRALQAGLHALAPSDDFPPLAAMSAHLDALHPDLSGELLFPAEVEDDSGLPAFTWMERAVAEQVVARTTSGEYTVPERAERLDPRLADRFRCRRDLHEHLRRARLLQPSELEAFVRRLRPTTDFSLVYDRLMPGAGWMRLRVEMSGPTGWQGELMRVRPDGRVRFDPGLRHLLARHCVVPLLTLQDWLADNLSVEVPRLARSWIGPFWFPGLDLPDRVPEPLRKGLVLHLSTEVVARDITSSVHRDPWMPPTRGERAPSGFGTFRERRFAVSPNRIEAARQWMASRGMDCVVVPLRPSARR